MGIFTKKKKISEPDIPGFAELEDNSSKKQILSGEILTKVPGKKEDEIDEERFLPSELDMDESNYDFNSEKIRELPEIPGSSEKDEEKEIIPELKKKLPEKITVDVKEIHENPSKMNTRNKNKSSKYPDEENLGENRGENFKESSLKQEKAVFIKIEDFNSVALAISEVKNKVKTIEQNINDIKTIKAKEDAEILAWERDLIEIREKLSSIDLILKHKIEE